LRVGAHRNSAEIATRDITRRRQQRPRSTTNILLGAEYLYYNFNNNVTGSAGTSPALPATLPLPFNYNWSKDNVQVFQVAGSYKF
jgi:hypothetical protein